MKKPIVTQGVTPPLFAIRRVLTVVFAAVLLAGCAKEIAVESAPVPAEQTPQNLPVLTVDELKFLSQADGNTRFEPQDVERIIGDAIGLLEGQVETRSGGVRAVESIEPLAVSVPATKTRSGGEQELFCELCG